MNFIEGLWGEKLPADRAHDANKLIALPKKQHIEMIIPPQSRYLEQRDYDRHTYKKDIIECFFEKFKDVRCIATQYDKLSIAFNASVMIVACLIWLQ